MRHIMELSDSKVAAIFCFAASFVFLMSAICSIFTGRIYMKNRRSLVDKKDGRFAFYSSIVLQVAMSFVLYIFAKKFFAK